MLFFFLVVSQSAAQTLQSSAAMLENIGAGAVVLPAEQPGGLPFQTGGADDGLLQRGKGGKRLLDTQPQSQSLQFVVSLSKLLGNAAVVLHFVCVATGKTGDFVQQLVVHVAADQPRQVDEVAAVITADKAQKDFPGNTYGIFAQKAVNAFPAAFAVNKGTESFAQPCRSLGRILLHLAYKLLQFIGSKHFVFGSSIGDDKDLFS